MDASAPCLVDRQYDRQYRLFAYRNDQAVPEVWELWAANDNMAVTSAVRLIEALDYHPASWSLEDWTHIAPRFVATSSL